ncbi:hypothetical protein RRG08_019038 [Elysia crispata]|uniref:Uncharacterized protein n=1 Tax=Elysia crispata TaxID=231223 RepID=A0AAE1DSS9_9GAST|nr:hypothetical protein RRG08_019038 [Elysia crispata]
MCYPWVYHRVLPLGVSSCVTIGFITVCYPWVYHRVLPLGVSPCVTLGCITVCYPWVYHRVLPWWNSQGFVNVMIDPPAFDTASHLMGHSFMTHDITNSVPGRGRGCGADSQARCLTICAIRKLAEGSQF